VEWIAHFERLKLNFESSGYNFIFFKSCGSRPARPVSEDTEACDSWNCLLEQFQSFAVKFSGEPRESGDISAGSRQALNES
jgi:hypothetical protein